MATQNHNLSQFDEETVPSGRGVTFGIVVSEWNGEVTEALLEGAKTTLLEHGVEEEDIQVWRVPGSFELAYASAQLVQTDLDCVIALGCVVRGETPHDIYICESVSDALAKLNTTQDTPVIFGLLTTLTLEQAKERAGGRLGNKGVECAITGLRMAAFAQKMTRLIYPNNIV